MAMSPLQAWTIFRSINLGQPEGPASLARLTEDEKKAYDAHVDAFQAKLAHIGIEANNEAADLFAHLQAKLETKRRADYTASDYFDVLSAVKGAKYEKLHLTAFFQVQNAEILLDLIKPAA